MPFLENRRNGDGAGNARANQTMRGVGEAGNAHFLLDTALRSRDNSTVEHNVRERNDKQLSSFLIGFVDPICLRSGGRRARRYQPAPIEFWGAETQPAATLSDSLRRSVEVI